MIDFDEREVPADVRARISDTVHRGLAEPANRRLRTPLAVAASVAVLLVAGLVTALALHGKPEQPPARPRPTVPPSPTAVPSDPADELDRCWQAIVTKGKQADFPPRSHWDSVERQPSTSANVTALRADGKTFFCLTTKAGVTVTDPNVKVTPVRGTSIRVVLADDNGWVLGTSGASDQYVTIVGEDEGVGVEPTNGVFLIHAPAQDDLASHIRAQLDDGEEAVPAPPAPAVEVTDRPLPAPDRTSANGKLLGECLDKAGWPKAYADQWQPRAATEHRGAYAVTADSAGQLGICTHFSGRYSFTPLDPVPPAHPPQLLSQGVSVQFPGDGGNHLFVMGTVPAAARSMTVTLEDGTHHPATVREGVWVLAIPIADPPTAVEVRDAAGKVIYSGALQEVGGK